MVEDEEVEVEASAPGKLILSGEHAVVHGYAAVAASLDLRTRCVIKRPSHPPDEHNAIRLRLSDLNLHLQWPLRDVKDRAALIRPDASNPSAASEEIIHMLKGLVDCSPLPEARIEVGAGVAAFLYLSISILGWRPLTATITSELPLGSGLGSSASFCVSITAALLAMARKLGSCHHEKAETSQRKFLKLDEEKLNLINRWAFEGEKILHGKPSGIDNTVSTFGYIVKFKCGHLSRIQDSIALNILLTNTKVGRNTKALVAGVGERALRHSKAMTAVFEATDAIAEEVVKILQTKGVSRTEEEAKLEELVEMNQGLLQCMGVSHPSIEVICRITSRYQLRSKLTGAGGGGCVLTVIPEQLSLNTLDKVKKDLEEQGFDCFKAAIGGEGVQVLTK